MLLTVLCIIAVDFRIFPRRFAKTETFGLSVMDVGVGTFLVTSAITSRYARGYDHISTDYFNYKDIFQPNNRSLQRFCVLLLGIGRMILLKMLHYHQHLSEYGQDWNFFVTLFFVWMITDLLHLLIPRKYILIVSIIILFIYQFILVYTPLTDYILTAPRITFFSSNREGILSLISLIPMYIIAEMISYHIFFLRGIDLKIESSKLNHAGHEADKTISRIIITDESEKNDAVIDRKAFTDHNNESHDDSDENKSHIEQCVPDIPDRISDSSTSQKNMFMDILFFFGIRWRKLIPPKTKILLKRLLIIVVILWTLWMMSSSKIQPTSRRLMNLAFVTFILSLSMTILMLIILADAVGDYNAKIMTLEYFNSYQLIIFFIANLLTGAINLSMKTIRVNATSSFMILLLYSFIMVFISWIVGKRYG
jgi:hypothetical protein